MSCGTGLVRTILFVCNIVVWLLGVALFALGLYIFIDGKDYSELMDGGLFSASVVLLVVGFLIALIGFLGCCGAVKKNGCMLLLYGILLLIVILIQVSGIVIAFLFQDDAESYIREGITKSMAAYGGTQSEEEAYTTALNLAQENLDCCGLTDYKDYSNATLAVKWVAAGNSTHVPDSCCITMVAKCGMDQGTKADTSVIHTQGCLTKLEDFVTNNLQIVGIVAIVFVVVEIFNLVFAFWLYRRYK
ncbi:hypothetical protein ACHWQZ_G002351 [Mnemiopsis leidyi]